MTALDSITIRPATHSDRQALERLAGRDSQRLPSDDFVIAEVVGEPRAAIGIRTGTVVADPFHPTADVADLLRRRAEGVLAGGATRRKAPRLRRRLAVAEEGDCCPGAPA